MASKHAKGSIVSKLGMKLGGSKTEMELDKLRKENAQLQKTIDELSNSKAKCTDSEKSRLLERILSLETLNQDYTQRLLAKEQEVALLREQTATSGSGEVASLQSQLDQMTREVENWEKLYKALSEETEYLKKQSVALSARCQELENGTVNGNPGLQSSGNDGLVVSSDIAVVQEHLRDALEKNQQWLVYDQQREAYVKAVLARTLELEQQLKQVNHGLQHQNKEGDSGDKKPDQMQEYYDRLLLTARKDMQAQKEQVVRVQGELADLRRRFEEKAREAAVAGEELRAERARACRSIEETQRRVDHWEERLRAELEHVRARLEEERQRSAGLLSQVNVLQKSLLNQREDQKRIALLEQQIQVSARDFENEKLDHQSLQKQLHKVLRELRKATDHIARLESANQPVRSHFPEVNPYGKLELDKLSIEDPAPAYSSPSRIPNLLDESFLECPKCRAQYPTSHHRELLAHIDYCLT